MRLKLTKIAALCLTISAVGCSKYSLTLNDGVVYSPAPLFKDYNITDQNLRNCVAQTIIDREIKSAQQLQRLVCTSAGIESLAGLDTFKQLRQLNLNSNALQDLDSLAGLSKLEILDVSDNSIEDASALLKLLSLKRLNIEQNTALKCADIEQLANFSQAELKLPKHCVLKNQS